MDFIFCGGSQFFTWALVVLGWVIVNRLNAGREKNKDLRDLIEKIRIEVLSVAADAVSYHTTQKQDFGRTEYDIITRLDRVSNSLDFVKKDFARRSIIEFRQSITLTNFQINSSGRVRYNSDSEFIGGIRDSATDLCRELESKYHSLY